MGFKNTLFGLEAISEEILDAQVPSRSTTAVAAVLVSEPNSRNSSGNNSGKPPRPPQLPSTIHSETTATAASGGTTTGVLPFTGRSLKTSLGQSGAWIWRTDLKESSKYWEGWYRGLSSSFLSLKVPKMLILAGTDRLDRDLTVGQMQGKFQLVLLSRAGHAVHEDEAGEVSSAVAGFIKRFQIGQINKNLIGVPGVRAVKPGESLFRVPANQPPLDAAVQTGDVGRGTANSGGDIKGQSVVAAAGGSKVVGPSRLGPHPQN